MLYSQNRHTLRMMYYRAWEKHLHNQPLEPIETQIVKLIIAHPHYQAFFEDKERALKAEFNTQNKEDNPFLHLGLHIAVQDQLATDWPKGFRELYQKLLSKYSVHDAEHLVMECLGQILRTSQHTGQPPSDADYLLCMQNLLDA